MGAHRAERLIDAGLTSKGIEEAVEKQNYANQIDFTLVYVSPMRRTIQTAYFLFKEHPAFDKIKFVLAPLARETL